MNEMRRFRKDIIESLRAVFSERPNAALQQKGIARANLSDLRGIESLLDRKRFPRADGRFVFLAAAELLRAQSESLQYLALSETEHLASETDSIDRRPDLPADFFKSSYVTAAAQLRSYQDQLDERIQAIYVSALSDPQALARNLRELTTWVALTFVDLVRFRVSILWLLRHRPETVELEAAGVLEGVAIDAAILSREIIASHISALACSLHLNGVGLNRRIPDVLARGRRIRLHGRLDRGKRTTIARLRRLPDGMFVRAQGAFISAKFVRMNSSSYFLGTLRDVAGDEISIVTHRNLLEAGLAEKSPARVSAYYRKQGSGLYAKEHLEIESLKIEEVYSQDIWKIAFLDLSTPYFRCWPFDLHIGFQPVAPPIEATGISPLVGKVGEPCADLAKEMKAADAEAKKADDAASAAAHTALWNCAAAFLACLFAETPPTAALCAVAAGKAVDSIQVWNDAHNKQTDAHTKAQAAFQAYVDCMFPKGPETGSSGSQGTGDPVGGFDDSGDPEQEIPDWVSTFGDDDGPPDPPDSWSDPDPPSFSFPDPDPPEPDQTGQSSLV
ncbi:MAG TPA: hypothetical protein VGW39_12775 [Chthoniobacterales bacterium]|nr:hypothetical protein [Chthoniobacterales bacterium]